MVDLLTPSKTADSGIVGHGIAQQRGRTVMNRRVTRRKVTITIVSTLLVGVLSTAAVAQVFLFAPAPDAARQERVIQQDPGADAYTMDGDAAICPGDCQLGREGEPDATGGTTGSAVRAAAAAAGMGDVESFPGEEGADANRTVPGAAEGGPVEFLPSESPTRSLPIVRPDPEVGPVERLPGDEDTSTVPSLAPDHEPVPQFGPQP